jgi:protein subunit release factor A
MIEELEDLNKILQNPNSEPELLKMANEEGELCINKLKKLEEQIITQLLPKEEADEGAAILEIRAGED